MDDERDIEIEKLHLDTQKAGEYGLALLNEKNQLQLQYKELNYDYVVVRCELEESNTQNGLLRSKFDEINNQNASFKSELEESNNQYVSLKSQLEELKNQLEKAQFNKNEEILKYRTNEENLLNEKQIREEHLNNEIKSYEQEVRRLKREKESLSIENKNLLSNAEERYKTNQKLNELNQKLKYDLKEKENQERLLLVHNTELDKQNIKLQQQVEKLGKKLSNYDRLNVENKQLQENIDRIQHTMQHLESLKITTDSQLLKLDETLRDERKQKYIYKQQLDDYIQKESLQNVNPLQIKSDDDDTYDIVSIIDYSHTSESDEQSSESLFSEIHKLEQECSPLSTTNCSLDNQLNENMKILFHKIEHFTKQMFPDKILSSTSNSDDTNDLVLKSIEQIDESLNLMVKQSNDTNKLQDQEQIDNLQKLLKESKETAVLALANLKSVHENEKSDLIETISKLRSESQRRMQAEDEEKRTLHALLRMAVEQKFILTQKLERYENKNAPS